ncbi:hypothetical protein ZIOFF_036005 [Zingiber officinale]|uniref:K-box domain-containing protein n=1 Tax=Zingiber officinale TaxID=94328 RepID=A0A8J5L8A7_ZINOF|nr:hypothetical protein ZIOFF_036005 [Zingiber officinale]
MANQLLSVVPSPDNYVRLKTLRNWRDYLHCYPFTSFGITDDRFIRIHADSFVNHFSFTQRPFLPRVDARKPLAVVVDARRPPPAARRSPLAVVMDVRRRRLRSRDARLSRSSRAALRRRWQVDVQGRPLLATRAGCAEPLEARVVEEWHLLGEDLSPLNVEELEQLERLLASVFSQARQRETQLMLGQIEELSKKLEAAVPGSSFSMQANPNMDRAPTLSIERLLEEDLGPLSVKELQQLEKQLESALSQIRQRKVWSLGTGRSFPSSSRQVAALLCPRLVHGRRRPFPAPPSFRAVEIWPRARIGGISSLPARSEENCSFLVEPTLSHRWCSVPAPLCALTATVREVLWVLQQEEAVGTELSEDLLEVILVLGVFLAGSTQTNVVRGFGSRAKVAASTSRQSRASSRYSHCRHLPLLPSPASLAAAMATAASGSQSRHLWPPRTQPPLESSAVTSSSHFCSCRHLLAAVVTLRAAAVQGFSTRERGVQASFRRRGRILSFSRSSPEIDSSMADDSLFKDASSPLLRCRRRCLSPSCRLPSLLPLVLAAVTPQGGSEPPQGEAIDTASRIRRCRTTPLLSLSATSSPRRLRHCRRRSPPSPTDTTPGGLCHCFRWPPAPPVGRMPPPGIATAGISHCCRHQHILLQPWPQPPPTAKVATSGRHGHSHLWWPAPLESSAVTSSTSTAAGTSWQLSSPSK